MIIVEHEIEGVTPRALARFANRARQEVRLRGEVNIRITSSREMQALNRRFRRMNKATDVLSFPALVDGLAGDIAISGQIAEQNAVALGHSPGIEMKILILHGLLHLAGHDHETDGGQMRALEARLRRKLGLPEGLIERANAEHTTDRNGAKRRLSPSAEAKRVKRGRRRV